MSVHNVRIDELAYRGAGVARLEGRVVFTPFTIPGEEVEIELCRERKGYAEAIVRRVVAPSPNRIEPVCAVHGMCPGCCYQHLDYGAELAAKGGQLERFLRRVPGFSSDVMRAPVAAPSPLGYRNKITLHVREDSRVGYIGHDNKTVVPISTCPLASPAINRRLVEICAEGLPPGCKRLVFREASREVHAWFDAPPARMTLCESTRLGQIQVPASGFFQVNPSVADLLLAEVQALLSEAAPERVLDLYCGSGLFGLAAAGCGAMEVLGYDYDAAAIECASGNAAALRLGQAQFRQADVHRLTARALGPCSRRTAWVLDPPRAGLDARLIQALIECAPPVVIYISCAPDTLARDLMLLGAHGYKPDYVRLFDMFPRTYGFETAVRLVRRA